MTAGYTMPNTTTTLTYNGDGPVRLPGRFDGDGGRFTPPTTYSIITRDDRGAVLVGHRRVADDHTNATAGQMNNVSVTISGAPADGDTFTIGPNTGASNDGRNALALSNLSTAKSLTGGTVTLTSAYANYVNHIGNQTNQIQTSSTAQTLAGDADHHRAAVGVGREHQRRSSQPASVPAAVSGEQQGHPDRADAVPDDTRHLPVRR